MDKKAVLEGLESFKERLLGEVLRAYEQRGSSFGDDRFKAWRRKFTQFLNDNLPGEVSTLNSKLSHFGFVVHSGESDAQRFWREDGETMASYIDSLKIDIENDEYDFSEPEDGEEPSFAESASNEFDLTQVFIVHGHDGEAKERTESTRTGATKRETLF